MKASVFVAAAFLIGSIGLYGDTVTIQNDTDAPVRFVLVETEEVQRFSLSSESIARFVEKFGQPSHTLPPGGVQQVPRPEYAAISLIGYQRSVRSDGFPLFHRRFDDERAFVVIDEEATIRGGDGEPAMLRRELAPRRQAPVEIDNTYSHWASIPDVVNFRRADRPHMFTRVESGDVHEANIIESLLWGRGGTQIDRIKALRWDNDIYVMVSTLTPFSRKFSLLMRVFDARESTEHNRLTIETPTDDRAGPVLAWTPDEDMPTIVGEYARSDFLLEARVNVDAIPETRIRRDLAELTVDVVSSLSDAGIREEFYHTTVPVSDIPRVHGP